MRAGNFFTDGVTWKFNMLLAEETGGFQEIGFAQSGFIPAARKLKAS
jgi:hypothetical protein